MKGALTSSSASAATDVVAAIPEWVDAEIASDAAGRAWALSTAVAPLDGTQRVVGPAFTAVASRDDNAVIQQLLEEGPYPGAVLVVGGLATSICSVLGDVTARRLRAAGFVALVTDGPVRDGAAIQKIGFPVWSSGTAMVAASKERRGFTGVPVSVGGVVICPGDIVIASASGVVVWPEEGVSELIAAAQRKHDTDEQRIRELEGDAQDPSTEAVA